ncbi:MAG: RpiB/LacA/LacB family sugar-phosphate isomerase [Patescibacteria group bacterium]
MQHLVFLGADHAGLDLKVSLLEHLEMRGVHVEDLGAYTLDPNDDYPQFASAVAEAVLSHEGSLGILVCGNAEGVCMVANKFDGIRAGIGFSIEATQTMRTDDDANILCLPGRIKTKDDPLLIAETFLQTHPSHEERHKRRLAQIQEIEKTV